MRKAATVDRHERSARRFKKAAWWLALIACVFPLAFRQVSVSDAWWHVALGKWLVEERSMPDLSRFYFSPWDARSLGSELRWEWLGDMALYFCHMLLGSFGLQILVVACVLLASFFLIKSGGDRVGGWVGGWTLLLLAAVCLGTYQLQLPRNSLFSLALYPVVLWLGCRRTGAPGIREYIPIGIILLLWSCLHGSCVLGWLPGAALFGARSFSAFRVEGRWSPRDGIQSLAVFTVSFGIFLFAMVAGRDGALHFLTLPARHVASAVESQTAPIPFENQTSTASGTAEKSKNLKDWLNASIWKQDASVPWSNDYWSPLDMLPGMRPIEAAYALAVAAAISALAFRNVPPGLLLAWLGAVFLGLGYVRMFGYTALASGAVIFVAFKGCTCAAKRWVGVVGWLLASVWLVFAWWLFSVGKVDAFIPEGQHVSRVGKVAIYDDATADWVKAEFPSERVFTTIESGSYCLLRWNFEKQVFLDGFFAPHTREVWNGYNKALRNGNPEVLHTQFGIKVAIVPTTSPQWVDLFLNSPDWNASAVGPGSAVFVHRSIPLTGRNPGIFFTASQLRETSFYFRSSTMRTLFQIVSSAKPERGAFRSEQWTAHPSFNGLRDLAKEVFPSL